MPKRYWAQGLKRDRQFQVRMSDEEYKIFQRLAREARLSLVVYARHRILGIPIRQARQPRSVNRPAVQASAA